jgi:NAD(P)-dependent dehydrogenase (short-subunit alcohol dehydrogenase family)
MSRGAIVHNASTAGVAGRPTAGVAGAGRMPSYTAGKHGVVGLTRSAALAYADRGVRVNALVTGNVDTPLYRRPAGAGEGDPLRRRIRRAVSPLPRRSRRSSRSC